MNPLVNPSTRGGLNSDGFKKWLSQLYEWLMALFARMPRYGTGSPEGVLVGSIGDQYIDRTGAAGLVFWFKEADEGLSTGWVSK